MTASKPQDFVYAVTSEIGGRSENQDFCGHTATKQGALFVLADGMGGHSGGALASQYFVEFALAWAQANRPAFRDDPEQAIKECVDEAGDTMIARIIKEKPKWDPHTTCVLVWISDQCVAVGHIGDSRAYGLATDGILWRTKDHSVVQVLKDLGELGETEITQNPEHAYLYKSIGGPTPHVPTVVIYPPLNSKEAVLLCSDGFWATIEDDELLTLVAGGNAQKRLKTLVDLVIKRNGADSDNVTAQLVIAQ